MDTADPREPRQVRPQELSAPERGALAALARAALAGGAPAMRRALLAALLIACAGAPPRAEKAEKAEKAEAPPEQIVPQEPPRPTKLTADLYAQAVDALAAGRDATQLLEETLRAQPDHALASENLTRLRIKSGRAVEAEKDLAARVAIAPGSLALRVQFV